MCVCVCVCILRGQGGKEGREKGKGGQILSKRDDDAGKIERRKGHQDFLCIYGVLCVYVCVYVCMYVRMLRAFFKRPKQKRLPPVVETIGGGEGGVKK